MGISKILSCTDFYTHYPCMYVYGGPFPPPTPWNQRKKKSRQTLLVLTDHFSRTPSLYPCVVCPWFHDRLRSNLSEISTDCVRVLVVQICSYHDANVEVDVDGHSSQETDPRVLRLHLLSSKYQEVSRPSTKKFGTVPSVLIHGWPPPLDKPRIFHFPIGKFKDFKEIWIPPEVLPLYFFQKSGPLRTPWPNLISFSKDVFKNSCWTNLLAGPF